MDDANNTESGNPESSSVLRLLHRYNQPWFGSHLLSGGRAKVVEIRPGDPPDHADAVVCYIPFLPGEEASLVLRAVRRMAARPQFYRLNWIRQLSTTSFAINLEGSHNRLSHCLGTLDLTSRFVRKIRDQFQPVELKAVLIYAFVHDCFHGPMGHTMDLIKDVIWGAGVRERIDKHLLLVDISRALKEYRLAKRENRPVRNEMAGILWPAVREDVAETDKECNEIFLHLEAFVAHGKTFMSEIVDNDIDADRLDYIWRDHTHLTMSSLPATLSHSKIDALIESIAVVEAPAGEKHLRFGKECRNTVEELLDMRLSLYSQYYENPVKIVADEMLTHALFYTLEQEGLLDSPSRLTNFATQFSYLTDDGLFSLLTDVTSDDKHVISRAILQDLRANRPFEIVYKKGLRRIDFPLLTRRYVALDHALKGILADEGESIREYVRQQERPIGIFNQTLYEAIITKYNRVAEETLDVEESGDWENVALPYSEQDDIYRIQLLYGDSYRKKILLERMLWRELLRRQDFEQTLGRLSRALAGPRTTDEPYVLRIFEKLRKTPLVFINLSWIPGISEQDLENHRRGSSPRRLRFHESGKSVDIELQSKVKPREEDYLLTICAPSVLLMAADMKQVISAAFGRFLKDRKWILLDAMKEEAF